MMKRAWSVLIVVFFVWSCGTMADRLLWVNAAGGLTGTINRSETHKIGIDCPREIQIEVKRLPSGAMAWRCGLVWPFYDRGESKALAELFDSNWAQASGTR